jgi:fructose-1,6-bisphosphatase/inositol monophosphatase family enzyme
VTPVLPHSADYFIDRLRELQVQLREAVCRARAPDDGEALRRVAECRDGDTIYELDLRAEDLLLQFCSEWADEQPFVLVAEGIEGSGWQPFPPGAPPETGEFILLVDPVDGTRGLMYDKRSAWSLAAVAPNRGAATTLADVLVAVQTELPTTRAYLADQLWAARGQGARGETHNLMTGARSGFTPRPSRATSLAHGFATISKFFAGGKALAARLEEALFEELLGPPQDGNPLVFDDEYISSGGQLYELAIGHDRFCADLRPLLHAAIGLQRTRLCAHPYDLATELIAREAGVVVTDAAGSPLRSPLDIRANIAWIGYANPNLQGQIEPRLHRLMATMGLEGQTAF